MTYAALRRSRCLTLLKQIGRDDPAFNLPKQGGRVEPAFTLLKRIGRGEPAFDTTHLANIPIIGSAR